MTDKKLLANLSKLGLPMFEPTEELDVNETLAEVVKSNDNRLWEGFPVLLANAAERYQFAPEKVEMRLMNQEEKKLFHRLVLMSGSLFLHYHLSFPWWNKIQKGFSKDDKALVKKWKSDLSNNQNLKWNDVELDPDRLKGLFELYFEEKAEKGRRRKEKYEEFSLEYALSQVFSPKQKELFKKKLEGLPLTKTEREYYSRSVKKKVVALANSELHSLSKKLLGL
ncbi:MAG: hypothetical protein SWH54_06135 [Thermodesulfobacteriota bacterium]|nr:hypothetical protein [Thermodesulfobacteriota bacterium]